MKQGWWQRRESQAGPEQPGARGEQGGLRPFGIAAAGLRASEERYRELYDGTPVMLQSIDEAGQLVSVNRHWLEVMGYERSEVLGRPVTHFLTPESAERAEREGMPRLRATGEVRNLELQFVTRSGQVLDVLLSSRAGAGHGRLDCSLAFALDVTEKKRAVEALRRSEDHLRRLFEALADGLFLIGGDGTLLDVNEQACVQLGRTRAEVIGHPAWEFSTTPPERIRATLDTAAAGRTVSLETEHVRKDGTTFPVEVHVAVFEEVPRRVLAALVRDISVRARAEQAEAAVDTLKEAKAYLEAELGTNIGVGDVVGSAPALRHVLRQVERVARTDTTVLVTGETGTGKELIATAIHRASGRADRLLVKVNCAALPAGLIESELFGHERGAFTGAIARKIGRFELADGGTLFLDEIGDLPVEFQAKLLRVLQEGEFERVGGARTLRADVRLVAATNRDLEGAVRDGRFRSDLYYRLNVFPIHLPPLRERRGDIPHLAHFLVQKHARRMGRRIERIDRDTMGALIAYDWPGNVRELENVIERALVLADGPILRLAGELRAAAPERRASESTLDDAQRDHIRAVLQRTGWRVSGPNGAARILGMKPTTLESRMKKLGIERPQSAPLEREA